MISSPHETRSRRPFVPWLLPVLALVLTGCITDMNAMRADINDLKQDSFRTKKELAELRGEFSSVQKEASTLKARAEGLPKEDTLAALRESQTTLYTQVSDTLKEMQTMSGRFEENKYFVDKQLKQITAEIELIKSRFDTLAVTAGDTQAGELLSRIEGLEGDIAILKAKLSALEAMPGKEPGEETETRRIKISPVDMYNDAYKAFEARQYAVARQKMESLIKDYPDHKLAGNARFWIGETYYNEGNFENAILAYEDVIQKHEGHQKVPDALLKQAYAFVEIGDRKTATGILRVIMNKFPKSSQADIAKKKLDTLK